MKHKLRDRLHSFQIRFRYLAIYDLSIYINTKVIHNHQNIFFIISLIYLYKYIVPLK